MLVVQKTPDLRNDIAQLQAQTLKVFALLAVVFGYIWLLWSMPPRIAGPAPPWAWIGVGLLTFSPVASYVLREQHLTLAAHLLVWSGLAAVVCATLTFSSHATVYLFIVPVVFASVLASRWAFLLVTGTSTLLAITLNLSRLRTANVSASPIPLASGASPKPELLVPNVALPVAIILLVAATVWLSARNLSTALAWFSQAYEQARHNERVAQDNQAELKRTLKALDGAARQLERTNHMLALARDQAEEARRLKQQFAQSISHELRTPLNLIVGFAELMTESPEYYGARLPSAYQRDFNIIYRNACHLQTLVNDVLDLARIEAAQMTIVPEEINPATLVEEAVETARSLVEAQGLELIVEIAPELPMLYVDPTRIRQVLFNLLNNAARFTEQGSVCVSVYGQDHEVVFAVADTGVGIAAKDLPHIFEEFQQVDGSTRRRHEGAGLGLAISRRFVQLHGGRMWVESELGKGSTFYFSLPTRGSNLIELPKAQSPTASSGASTTKEEAILLAVTRSPSAGALLMRYLHGFRTVVVPDLQQAEAAARLLMPQAIIVDQACQRLEPIQVEALAQQWGLPSTPFIVCPLPGEEPLRQRLNVNGYLIKPVRRQDVWDVLRQFDEDIERILLIDDDPDFVLLLGRMLENNPVRRYQVMSAYGGQEGLALLSHRRPDLIFLDLMLPDIDGLQVIEYIRSRPAWQHLPIVVISAQDEMNHRQALKGAMTITKVENLTAGDVVRWLQGVIAPAALSQTDSRLTHPEPRSKHAR